MTGTYKVVVVGSGAAGLAAALEARRLGDSRVLLIDRDDRLGGILNQCVHAGFGLQAFGEELTGPEYAWRFVRSLKESGVEVETGATVLNIAPGCVEYVNRNGYVKADCQAIVLATGCRERTRGALMIPGSRPAGVLTAGAAQRLMNIEGQLVGHNAVILGSGDVGLIVARRLSLEGGCVRAVVEIKPYETGLIRNVVQCLDDFGIPLLLGHTITCIVGRDRVEAVKIARVDDSSVPISGTESVMACDTVVLSVGLIPENELSRAAGMELDGLTGGPVVDQYLQTSLPGVLACGNGLHISDVVDAVTEEGQRAGRVAAWHASGQPLPDRSESVRVVAGKGIRSVVPQLLSPCLSNVADSHVDLKCRIGMPLEHAIITVNQAGKVVHHRRLPVARPSELVVMGIAQTELESCLASGEDVVVRVEAEG